MAELNGISLLVQWKFRAHRQQSSDLKRPDVLVFN